MDKVLGFFLDKIGLGFILKFIYYGLLVMYYTAIIGMWISFVVAFSYFFNQVQATLDMINLGSSNETVSKFYGLLHCIGFLDALNDSKSVWLSGLAFIFSRILYTVSISTYTLFMRSLTPLLGK